MCAYKKQILDEIEDVKQRIKELYDELNTPEGKSKMELIYSKIANHQQSIRAKKQRYRNYGKSFITVNSEFNL